MQARGTRLRDRSEYMHFGDGSGADPYADGNELDSLCVTKALESTVTGTRAGTGELAAGSGSVTALCRMAARALYLAVVGPDSVHIATPPEGMPDARPVPPTLR